MKRIPIVATMKRTPFVAAIIAIAAGVALAFALPAGAAVSQQSPPVAADPNRFARSSRRTRSGRHRARHRGLRAQRNNLRGSPTQSTCRQ